MRLWTPPMDEPHRLDWWLPLVRAARRALTDEVPWLILVDEWQLRWRVGRRPRPDVWVYAHHETRRELFLDGTGQPYRFIPARTGRSLGQFRPIDIRAAIWRAGLPYASEPVFFEPQRPLPYELPDVDAPPEVHAEPPSTGGACAW